MMATHSLLAMMGEPSLLFVELQRLDSTVERDDYLYKYVLAIRRWRVLTFSTAAESGTRTRYSRTWRSHAR